jgi:uncharacterized protein
MYVFVRANNPRPTFLMDMTADERTAMQQHVGYWAEKAAQGIAVVFGPVADPKGVWGMGVYRVSDLAEMQRMLEADPARHMLDYDVFEMPRGVIGSGAPGVHPWP